MRASAPVRGKPHVFWSRHSAANQHVFSPTPVAKKERRSQKRNTGLTFATGVRETVSQSESDSTDPTTTAATHAKAAGCEWLHVDFEPELAPFYFDACGFRPTDAGLIHLPSFSPT